MGCFVSFPHAAMDSGKRAAALEALRAGNPTRKQCTRAGGVDCGERPAPREAYADHGADHSLRHALGEMAVPDRYDVVILEREIRHECLPFSKPGAVVVDLDAPVPFVGIDELEHHRFEPLSVYARATEHIPAEAEGSGTLGGAGWDRNRARGVPSGGDGAG